jgi:hypothetical protein
MFVTILSTIVSYALFIVGKLAFIWGPILAMYVGLEMWHHFVTDRFILGMKWTVFEIEVPRDVEKTPMAMELILTNAMYHASIKGLWEVWISGAPHFWFSLEMAGIDGQVHFYIRSPSRIADLVENQIYAQYPQAKVKEVPDYTLCVDFDAPNDNWHVWGCEFKLQKHDAWPIRTYKDYGLDKPSDKEQQKIDPLTPMIEYLGSLPRGQQIWIQHVIRPSKKSYHNHHTGAHQGWIAESEDEIFRVVKPYTQEFLQTVQGQNDKHGDIGVQIRVPDMVSARVKKIQEKMQKLGFDIGTRVVAVGDKKYCSKDDFDSLRRSCRLLFRQFNNPDLNSLIRINATQFDQAWGDPTGLALYKLKNRMLNWYRLRIFYHPPFWVSANFPKLISLLFIPANKVEISVMNVEEIATLFHFPGQVSQAPSFKRIESRVAKPPSNLPI